ncbi:MAG TPA: hypothetical protein VKK31_08445 [Thermoanaerobaculia bacterium]|nr:hypothetical protein [Thermoanaerobaculia bacterium]
MNLRRASGPLLLLLTLAAASRPVPASAAPLLTAPREGVELRAGSLAAVAWEDAPPEAVEWEAFLSLDGGRSYPLRITPHLDLSIRRFHFQVPAFPTRDGRILLRFGDERREVEVETPQRFSIVPGTAAWPADLKITLSRGEKARPQDPGVVVWIEGARDGSGLREVVTETEVCSVRSVETGRLPWLPLLWPSPNRTVLAAPAVASTAARTPLPQRLETVAASPPVLTSIRVLTGRLNE